MNVSLGTTVIRDLGFDLICYQSKELALFTNTSHHKPYYKRRREINLSLGTTVIRNLGFYLICKQSTELALTYKKNPMSQHKFPHQATPHITDNAEKSRLLAMATSCPESTFS